MTRKVELSYELSMAIKSALPRCGECYWWMKSQDCPREHNVKGMSRGPSSHSPTCDKFKAKDDATAARVAERWKPASDFLAKL